MLTPPYNQVSLANQKKNQTYQVAQFIATTVYYLFYEVTADQEHPEVIGFRQYIQNILECSSNNVNVSVIFTCLLYVERYVTAAKKFGISITGSEIKVWSAALMLADVFLNDAAYAVKSWADVTGIQIRECIIMRKTFLETINYSLAVTMKEYDDWVARLNVISDHVNSVLAYKARQGYIQQEMVYQSLMKQPHNQPYTVSCSLNSNKRTTNIDYGRRPSNDVYQAAMVPNNNSYDIQRPLSNFQSSDLVVFTSHSPNQSNYSRNQNRMIPNSNYFLSDEQLSSSINTPNYYLIEERNYSPNNNIPIYNSHPILPYHNQNYGRITNSIDHTTIPSASTPGNFEYQSSADTLIKSPMSFKNQKYQKSQRSFVVSSDINANGVYFPPSRQYSQGW